MKKVAFPIGYTLCLQTEFKSIQYNDNILNLEPQHGLLCSVKKLASNAAIPVKTVDSFSSTEFEDEIKALQLDLLIVRIGEILPTQVFSSPRLGTWCVHSSILPSARGIAGEFHVLRNANLPMGSTIFRISENLDSTVIANTNIPKRKKNNFFGMFWKTTIKQQLC